MSTYVINPTEEQGKIIEAFLEALDITFVKNDNLDILPEHVIKGIQEGIEDFEAGRYITMGRIQKDTFYFQMIFEVVFSKKAKETFDAIRSQIFNRWGERGVSKFEHQTIKVLEIISKNPVIYQGVEYDKTIRKAHLHKNCSIFYQVRNEKIILAFFWDNRQDPIFL